MLEQRTLPGIGHLYRCQLCFGARSLPSWQEGYVAHEGQESDQVTHESQAFDDLPNTQETFLRFCHSAHLARYNFLYIHGQSLFHFFILLQLVLASIGRVSGGRRTISGTCRGVGRTCWTVSGRRRTIGGAGRRIGR